eukprot:SAG22_NODE_2233_length_2809_cov_7.105166_4_plen_65_part_00
MKEKFQKFAWEQQQDTLRAQYEEENPPEPQVEGGDYLLAHAGPDGVPVIRKEDEVEEDEWEIED